MAVENSNGRRWYDSSRVIAWLFSLVMLFVMAWSSLVFTMSRESEAKNIEQDGRLNNLTYMLEKIDSKLDRVLEKR